MCCDTALKGEATAVLPPCCSTSLPPAGVSSTLGSVRWRIRERLRRRGGREAIWVEQHEALWLYPLMRCRVGKKMTAYQLHIRNLYCLPPSLSLTRVQTRIVHVPAKPTFSPKVQIPLSSAICLLYITIFVFSLHSLLHPD